MRGGLFQTIVRALARPLSSSRVTLALPWRGLVLLTH